LGWDKEVKLETRNLNRDKVELGTANAGQRSGKFGIGSVVTGLGLTLLCSSCSIIPLPEHEVDVPEAYRASTNGVALVADWWTAFGDEQLNALMETTLAGNLSIEQAAARLRQAEASAVKSGAARFPSLTGSGEGETTTTGYRNSTINTADNYSLGLKASYELDLWGRVASTRKAALRSMDSSRYDLQTAAMTIAAETVDAYFEWQLLNARLALLTEQLDSRRNMLSVIEERFKTSSSDALDVLNQREAVASAEAAIPPVRASLQAAYNALAILTGRPPQTDLGLAVKTLPELPARPAAGLPADLLAMRPDLQSAWADLGQADWNVRAAQAARLPAITLTGSINTSDEDVDNLFDNWISNLAAGLALPLIDGGSLRAEVRRTKAVSDEQVAAYRETVYEAFAEVEDAISAEQNQQERLEALARQSEFSKAAAEETYRRYTRGLETYYDALNSRTSYQTQQVSELIARTDLIAARVQLCRVLGGNWETYMETGQ
jgi:NodT family efflux transporter outer membrane factor (OMF) lipoprotein